MLLLFPCLKNLLIICPIANQESDIAPSEEAELPPIHHPQALPYFLISQILIGVTIAKNDKNQF